FEGTVLAQQRPRRVHALFDGVGPVLDAHGLVEDVVVPAGDITRGDDPGNPGGQVGCAAHAVGEVDRRAGQPGGRRHGAHSHEERVGGQGLPGVEYHLSAITDRVQRVDAGGT